MADLITHFHFVRPLWLLMGLVGIAIYWLLSKRQSFSQTWSQLIDQQLLEKLLDNSQTQQSRWPLRGLLAAWIIASIALAGPTWERIPQPLIKQETALVILFDQSLSMLAEDLKPSRLQRAKHKLADVLEQRKEGLTALVAYAGDAHIVSPLTDDNDTIATMLPALSPLIMPEFGSDLENAIATSQKLLQEAGAKKARLLIVTDGINESGEEAIEQARSNQLDISILAVGTTEGAPIPLPQQGFLKDSNGAIVMPKLEESYLKSLASNNRGRYANLSYDDDDIEYLLSENIDDKGATLETERQYDQWFERGPWLALLLLPIVLFAFRRGVLLSIGLICFVQPEPALAWNWSDLWQTRDQQGQKQIESDPKQAAELFKDPQWKGSSHYKAGEYEQALEQFNKGETTIDQYNLGNTLAQLGKYDEAIAAYDQVLQQQPDHQDALANKELLEKIKQQQQNQQNQQGDPNQSNQDQENQDQNGQNQDSQGQQNDQQSESGQDQNNEQQSAQQQDQNKDQNKDQSQDQQGKEESQDSEENTENAQQQSRQGEDAESKQLQGEQLAQTPYDELSNEEKQALEQWLRRVPDDPSIFLKNKFRHQYQQRLREGDRRATKNKEQQIW